MNKFLSKYLYLIPPIMLIASFVSHFVDFNYVILGNILGYSLLTNIVFVYIFIVSNKNYCFFTKFSVIALPFLNVLCIFGNYINYETYGIWYEIITCSIVFLASIILALRKI